MLENFEISREILSEMRRNYAFQTTIIFGMLQFRVTELVRKLNEIISMNDIFSSLSFDERGFKLKKDPAKESKTQAKKKDAQNVIVGGGESDDEESKAAEAGDKKNKKAAKEGGKDAKAGGKDAKAAKGKPKK